MGKSSRVGKPSRPYRGAHTGKGGAHGAKSGLCGVIAIALIAAPVGVLAAGLELLRVALS